VKNNEEPLDELNALQKEYFWKIDHVQLNKGDVVEFESLVFKKCYSGSASWLGIGSKEFFGARLVDRVTHSKSLVGLYREAKDMADRKVLDIAGAIEALKNPPPTQNRGS